MGEPVRPAPRRSLLEHLAALVRWIGPGRIAAVVASVLLVAAGAVWLLRSPEAADPGRAAPAAVVVPPTVPPTASGVPGAVAPCAPTRGEPCPSTGAASTSTPRIIVVHVAGAVVAPGVYSVAAESRVGDAVSAAGGGDAQAALDAVNLAAPLTDGQQVYVPRTDEASGPAAPAATDVAAPVDLNQASMTELLDLPGVGPVLAAAIVRHREESGPFASVDDLLAVSGIGPARLATLRDLVRV